jgi:hypothetical protein
MPSFAVQARRTATVLPRPLTKVIGLLARRPIPWYLFAGRLIRAARSSGRLQLGVVPGYAQSIEDAASHRQVLLGAAAWQPSGSLHDMRLPYHLVVGELLASQVELGPAGQQIPVVHPLVAAIAANDLSNQQFAAEQVMDDQRGRPALAAGGVGGGPVISIDRVTGIERPRCAYRGLKVLLCYSSHARNPAKP